MKLLYITTVDPRKQGDFQEVMILNGLRSILGQNVIDFPRKKVMYRDFSETPQRELHGSGFTLYTKPIEEIENRKVPIEDYDAVLYGVTDSYGITDYHDINNKIGNVFYIDGHDHDNITKTPCFKRELFREQDGVYPTGFGIPHYQIHPIRYNKTQIIQKTTPKHSVFQPATDLGTRYHHIFTNEEDYFNDMAQSWFGLTSKKGGWDSLRHYEIIASGSCLLFRDYDKKPHLCSPQNLPTYSYSTKEELDSIINRLLVNRKPTDEYWEMVFKQRGWLLKYGTTEARSLDIIKTINENGK